MDDEVYALMVDLAAALQAVVSAGKVSEVDLIIQEGSKEGIGAILDRAEAMMVKKSSFAI